MSKQLTTRQAQFIDNYNNPTSLTRGNAYQSAKKAGYSEEYSRVITSQMPRKISEKLGKESMVEKAKQVLADTLEFQDKDNAAMAAKIRWDAAKFTLSTTKEYSSKQETKTEVDVTQNALTRLGEILEGENGK